MPHPEEVARNHPAFDAFKVWCEETEEANHPDSCDWEDWEFGWKPFVAGYNAALRMNGLLQ